MAKQDSCVSQSRFKVKLLSINRRPLFKGSAVLTHQTGKGGAAFDWRARLTTEQLGLEEADDCKLSLFVEPLKWMRDAILQQTGKVSHMPHYTTDTPPHPHLNDSD